MSTHTAQDQAYSQRIVGQTLVFALVVVALGYITLIRPFTTGFDLASVMEGKGVQEGTLISRAGAPLQNKIEGVSVLILQGPNAGNLAELDALEQVVGSAQPTLHGLTIQGAGQEAFEISSLQPGDTPGTFTAQEGVSGSFGGQEFVADSVVIDDPAGRITTQGETRIFTDEFQIETAQGAEIDRNGDIRVGKEPQE